MTVTLTTPSVSGGPTTGGGALSGTRPLLRASIKHNARLFAPWIILAGALSASSVLAYPRIFPTTADRAALAGAIGGNPALGLIFGPANDLFTADGFNSWRSLALGGFLAALGVILTLVRATRAQEDSGQAELLASGVMGRATRLMAAVVMCLSGSLFLGVVVAAITIAFGGALMPSLLLAATMTATGWMFTGVAAITAQLGSDARTANSLAVGTLGVLFLARGFVYTVEAPEWLIWANPLGWMTQTQPAHQDNWWPLLLAMALTFVLLLIAFALQARRDFAMGAIPVRPGPARGREGSPWRLALRVNHGPLITWTGAFTAIGFAFGYLTTSLTDVLRADSGVGQVLASGATRPEEIIGAAVATIMALAGILAAIPGVQIMLKIRSEELADRVEPVIATAVTRPRYFASNVGLALLAPAVYMLIAGTIIAALAAGAEIGITFTDALTQAVAMVPAVWTVVGLSATVVGAWPRMIMAAWLGVVASFVLTILGPTFKLWDWVMGISPFYHVPIVAQATPDWTGLLWITVVTVLCLGIGFSGFRRRDLAC